MLKVKLLSHTPNVEEVVASAAKLCYSPVGVEEILEKQSKESIDSFINKLLSINHLSPFEHGSFSFAIEGVSRITEIQLVRHRIASYSIQSGRYVKRDNPEFVIPPDIANNFRAKNVYLKQMKSAQEAYDILITELLIAQIEESDLYDDWINQIINIHGINASNNYLDRLSDLDIIELLVEFKEKYSQRFSVMEKKAVENARYAHPQAIATKIVVTMNTRSLMNFFSLRCCSRAQWEIRAMADLMLKEVYKIAPAIFSKSGAPCTNGKCPEGLMSCGKPRKMKDIIGEDNTNKQLTTFE